MPLLPQLAVEATAIPFRLFLWDLAVLPSDFRGASHLLSVRGCISFRDVHSNGPLSVSRDGAQGPFGSAMSSALWVDEPLVYVGKAVCILLRFRLPVRELRC
eukprot:RCo045292